MEPDFAEMYKSLNIRLTRIKFVFAHFAAVNGLSIPVRYRHFLSGRAQGNGTMAVIRTEEVVFGLPGGETSPPAYKRPVDLVHLARHTLGDRELEREILNLFIHQMAELSEKLKLSIGEERRNLAHQLKGSARGIGAFQLADCAESIEDNPDKPAPLKALAGRVREVREYIASINR